MHEYKLIFQFLDPNAPDFTEPEIMAAIDNAITFYNSQSVPHRKITDYCQYAEGALAVTLESKRRLTAPTKAFQKFTDYLKDPDIDNSLYFYTYNKSLFRILTEKEFEEGFGENSFSQWNESISMLYDNVYPSELEDELDSIAFRD